jgi:hypothetical protein
MKRVLENFVSREISWTKGHDASFACSIPVGFLVEGSRSFYDDPVER